MKKIIILIVIIAAIVFFWSYGRDTLPTTPEIPAAGPDRIDVNPTTGEGTITTPPAPDGVTGVREFTVIGGNFSFTPNTLEVKQGDTVRIAFKNANGFHDFKLDEFNVASGQIRDGESETVEFIADKAGSFEYYCSVGNHRAMGMKGTLTVNAN